MVLDAKQAGMVLGVKPNQVRRMVMRGELPALTKTGNGKRRKFLFDSQELRHYVVHVPESGRGVFAVKRGKGEMGEGETNPSIPSLPTPLTTKGGGAGAPLTLPIALAQRLRAIETALATLDAKIERLCQGWGV